MIVEPNGPREKKLKDLEVNDPEQMSQNEISRDSVEHMSPTDDNADEKVIVNEQREHKTVNAPSQTAVNTSEGISNDEDTIDNS